MDLVHLLHINQGMIHRSRMPPAMFQGTTIIEVLASALLIFLGLGAIFALNTQSLQILHRTRLTSNGSQILQQRIEGLRNHPWPEIANAAALAIVLQTPVESEKDLADADPTETITISVPQTPGSEKAADSSFEVQRRRGAAKVLRAGDLGTEPLLLVEMTLTWQGKHSKEERKVRTIIGRSGLTRSGIFGSAFGRPEQGSPKLTAP
jgi:Tfp pilus assembly protein PilV